MFLEQDPPEATKASEEAADAVEEVAELAEARSGNQAGLKVEEPQASVGSRQADGQFQIHSETHSPSVMAF